MAPAERPEALFEEAAAALSGGDRSTASDKGWEAAVAAMRSAARSRGWPSDEYRDLFEASNRLADQGADSPIARSFRIASILPMNAGDDFLPEQDLREILQEIGELLRWLREAAPA